MCGISAVYLLDSNNEDNVVDYLHPMLMQLQHRGQQSAGIATFAEDRIQKIKVHTGLGEVKSVFLEGDRKESKELRDNLKGHLGIGHVRYATSGNNLENKLNGEISESEKYATQPFKSRGLKNTWDWFSFSLNGNISNEDELLKEFQEKGFDFMYPIDTEIIRRWIKEKNFNLEDKPDLVEMFSEFSEVFEGSYSLTFMNAVGELAVLRDPKSIMPLVYGYDEKKGIFASASESGALQRIGIKEFDDVKGGEIIIVDKDKRIRKQRFADSEETRHCSFQDVYFARSDSIMDGEKVETTRRKLGVNLAKLTEEIIGREVRNNENYIVIPVPNTAKSASASLAEYLDLRERDVIEDVGKVRSFINDKEDILEIIKNKYVIHGEDIVDKNLIIVDDSIVRSNTAKALVELLKDAGAKEINFLSTFGKIQFPCYMGMDFPTVKELIAPRFDGDEKRIAEYIGADRVIYLPDEKVKESIGKEGICMSCLTGNYPFPSAKRRAEKEISNYEKFRIE